MDTARLNQWLTLGANLAVLVGILLLVAELAQNRELMRAQMRTELSNGIIEILGFTATNPVLAEIVQRADNGEELTHSELLQYRHRVYGLFRYLENLHYQYRIGLFEEQEYSSQKLAWAAYLNNSNAAATEWCRLRPSVSPKFRKEVDAVLERHRC